MTQESYFFFDTLIKSIGGITALAGGLAFLFQIKKNREERKRATDQQKEDLQWRRAEFLIGLWRDFNADLTLRPCVKLVDEGDRNTGLSRIMGPDPWNLNEEDSDIRYNFDRYLDFLESLAYCEQKHTLTLDEVECFGWHFEKILESQILMSYCSQNGYYDVISLAKTIVNPEMRSGR